VPRQAHDIKDNPEKYAVLKDILADILQFIHDNVSIHNFSVSCLTSQYFRFVIIFLIFMKIWNCSSMYSLYKKNLPLILGGVLSSTSTYLLLLTGM